ncbi:uncharacterized protein LOC111715827 isoform X1 [Eurytemora carolleeae]|uniref:uncharacterized protein LOC111715827 isoform X1 n=1 Tax=Eurytemora carolleeae TaxID=1294199 RepID=UPI000C76A4F9|nr:uncharacterized protein LOC111715827 isoform X1 [Eurytemora carolleeae]|eukprot:XP_023346977.1 uncharacterized protein LOC111715827 isoform X1 [Eurytemora affinis]
MMLSKCSSSFAYWDIHNQKFKGRWSTYLSTVVYKGEQENREPDSFFHQTLRIGFNNWGKHFQYDLETEEIGIATYEGYRLNAFLEMYQLQAIFLYNDEVWGTLDEETGKWNGVIGMVGYGGADIGVCSISYTFERSLLVDCTTICLLTWLDGWTTKYPEKRPAYENLLKVFDKVTWFGILVSLISTSIGMLFISKMVKALGFKQPDNVLVALIPFSLINAEAMPDLFLFSKHRVYSGSLILLTWALASALLTMGFSSNLRAILLAPSWDPFLDTHSQIAQRGMTLAFDSEFMVYYDKLSKSEDSNVIKIMSTTIFVHNKQEMVDLIADKGIANLVFFDLDLIPEDYKLYTSDEHLTSDLSGWIMQKRSKWQEILNHFECISHQAALSDYIDSRYSEIKWDEETYTLERLSLEHVVAGFVLLGIGLGTATLVFCVELLLL